MTIKTQAWIACVLICPAAFGQQAAPATQRAASDVRVKKLIGIANAVEKQVETLRGWNFKHAIKKGVYSEKQLRAFLEKKLFTEEYAGDKLEHQQAMLRLLGLIPGKMDLAQTILDVLLSQVGGFYDPEQESFFMLEKAATFGEFLNRMMIAHELTHALDDQYFGLDKLMKARQDEHDASFAIGSVVEGSATALMYRWAAKFGGQFDRSEMKKAMQREQEQSKVLLNAPPYFATLVARYMVGLNFLNRGRGMAALVRDTDGIAAEVKDAFHTVPASSEQVLHPAKYWDVEKRDEPVRITNDDAVAAALEKVTGAKAVMRETLGEIHMALLGRSPKRKLTMQLMAVASAWTNKAARGWGGDRLYLLRQGGSYGIVWISIWDTVADAGEFEAAYRKHYSAHIADMAKSGKVLLSVHGFEKAPRASELLEVVLGTAKLVKGGQPFH